MDTTTWLAVIAFATVTSITPGPNNMMLLASGVNHGFRASWPHMLGISLGFTVLLLSTALGLGALMQQWPLLSLVLKGLGAAYLGWMAWRLWHADAPRGAEAGSTSSSGPMGFWAAAAFQWVNPKAWMMSLAAVAGFLAPDAGGGLGLLLALLFGLVNLPCIALWAYAGARLSRQLADPARRRVFNAVMAVLLLASLWPMLRS